MIEIILILLLAIFTITDTKSYLVSNLIVIPAIVLGAYFTHSWLWALICLAIATVFIDARMICPECQHVVMNYKPPFFAWKSGDVKICAMLGAFLGWKGLIVIAATMILIISYRLLRKVIKPLPVSPFFLTSTIITIATSLAFSKC